MFEVIIPKMGMSTVEVDIVEWFVNIGDSVKHGDPLLEIESEKSAVVIESEVNGIIEKILKPAEESVNVGDIVCLIRKTSEEA